jgi:hypothetical protein
MLSSSTKVYGKLSSCRSGFNLLGYHYSYLELSDALLFTILVQHKAF